MINAIGYVFPVGQNWPFLLQSVTSSDIFKDAEQNI